MDIEVQVDPELGPALAQGYMVTAAALLLELAKARGDGEWFEVLREAIRWQAFELQAPDDSHPEVVAKWPQAAMMAVDHIFDHIEFEPKRPRG